MKTILVVFVFLFMGISGAHAGVFDRCDSNLGNCSFYDCLSEKMQCQPDSFIRQIAAPYCRYFQTTTPLYTPAGKKVLDGLRVCLQKEIRAHAPVNCNEADQDFANAHVDCYLSGGFCTLPMSDKWRIARAGFSQLSHPIFLKASLQIILGCGDPETAAVFEQSLIFEYPFSM